MPPKGSESLTQDGDLVLDDLGTWGLVQKTVSLPQEERNSISGAKEC